MTYFCFIESSILHVPHMEPLVSENPEDAREEARELMALHTNALAAHVFHGDQRIATVMPDENEAFGAGPSPSSRDGEGRSS